jgi:EpsI family protein
MPEKNKRSHFDFLRSKPVIAVTVLLAAQIAIFYSVPTKEYIPTPPPLERFVETAGEWRMSGQTKVDADTMRLLKADDTLSRMYAGPARMDLFVAFFKSQRAGVTPHSPKVCLPGNGWVEESSGTVSVRVPGEKAAITVNRYVVTREEERNLVLYWYQNQHRVTANEYLSKFYLVYDALRYHRSDEALVRVITPLGGPAGEAEERAVQFIQAVYLPLKQQLWGAPANAEVRPEQLSADRPH